MTDNKECEAFEAWLSKHPDRGDFTSHEKDYMADAWQARAALAASQEKAESVAYVDGDDSLRRILWEPDQAAFNLPVGTKLYAAPVAAQAGDSVHSFEEVPFAEFAACATGIAPVAAQASTPVALYTMDEMRAYADEFHQARLNAAPQPSAEAVRDAVRTFWQQHTPSDALSMSLPELHNDVECVIRGHRASAEAVRNAALEEAANVAMKAPITADMADNNSAQALAFHASARIRALKSAPPQPAEQPGASPAVPVVQGLTDDQIVDAANRAGATGAIRLITSGGGPTWVARNLVHEILARAQGEQA